MVQTVTQTTDRGRAAPTDETPILTLPGLDGSGDGHWQTHWERLSSFRRVEFPDGSHPRMDAWVETLDRAISESARAVVLAAHSLGCLAAVWWAAQRARPGEGRVLGALLVAPPDVDMLDAEPRIRDFRPTPSRPLPFRSVLVASRSDPYASFACSRQMAASWRSEFVDAGAAGHLNAESGLGEWSAGLRHLAKLCGRNANLMVAELGLRTVLT